MKKTALLLAAVCLSAPGALAQYNDSIRVEDDNADFSFTESQLDEDNDASQVVSSVISAKADPYLSEVGYRWSGMRFRVRAYDNQYNQMYMNGLQLNDLERGSFSYGMIGGMNDATRNREGVDGYEYNTFALQGIGGATQLNTRASQFAQGSKLALSGTNRNYVLRGMLTHATGILPSGWSFAGSIGYRWAKEGVIEGTFYNAFSYFLAAEKRLGNGHSIGLVTFGTPTERGQQGASTEEVYWLANSHYYNPNWGYQDGKKRNSRVVNSFEPTTILTWDWKIDDRQKLTTSAGFRYSNYGSTALGWGGDAYDPRPDYYKNLPSSIFNVYDPAVNNYDNFQKNPFLLEQYNTLLDYWTSSKANRQVNWDRMYYVNRQNEANGGETLYYQERRHNDQLVGALSSTYNFNIDAHNKFALGLQLNHTKGMHYKTMADLLGGTRYTDIDKFAANDYGVLSQEAQNDLRNPNRQIEEGDKFGYNYNIFVNKANLWGNYGLSGAHYNLSVGGHVEGTTIEREGLMQNGRAPENSYGKSGAAKFLGGGGKVQFVYRPVGYHRIFVSAHYDAAAPLARNSFVAPRMQNDFVDRLKLENIYGAELSYSFRFGDLTGKLTGFYSRIDNGVEQTAFYNDQEERFTYLTMSNVEREYYGLEAAFVYQVDSRLSFNFLANISDAKYVNNPYAQVNYEGMNASTIASLNQWTNAATGRNMPLRVLAKDMRVNGTPLTALSLGANYNINGWFFEANLNYYDRVFVDFSEYRRLSNVVENTVGTLDAETGRIVFERTEAELKENGGVLLSPNGEVLRTYAAKQEQFDGGFMLDLSIGRFIRLKKGKTLSINLAVNNVTNNRNMRTGGYEQNRDDFYNTQVARAYVFSRNAKYYYANALNAFLNISFKF